MEEWGALTENSMTGTTLTKGCSTIVAIWSERDTLAWEAWASSNSSAQIKMVCKIPAAREDVKTTLMA